MGCQQEVQHRRSVNTEFCQVCYGELGDLVWLPDALLSCLLIESSFLKVLCCFCLFRCFFGRWGWKADIDTTEFILLEKKYSFQNLLKEVHFLSEHQIITKQNVTTDFSDA